MTFHRENRMNRDSPNPAPVPSDGPSGSDRRRRAQGLHARTNAAIVVGVVVAYAVGHVLGVIVLPLPVPPTGAHAGLTLTVGILLTASLCFGTVGVLGSSLGYVLVGIASGTSSVLIVSGAVGTGLFGLAVSSVRYTFGNTADQGVVPRFERSDVIDFLSAVIVASLAAGIGTATVVSLLGEGPFYLYAPSVTIVYLLASVLIGTPLLYTVVWVVRRTDRTQLLADTRVYGSSAETKWVVGILVTWLLVGSVADIGFTILRAPPATWYRSRIGFEFSTYLANTLQILAVSLTTLLAAVVFVARGTLTRICRRYWPGGSVAGEPPEE